MSELSLKFLRGARKAIQVGGFDAQILRTVDGGVNVLDPLGPNLLPVTTSYDVRVFVDAPKTYYSETSGLVKIGDGVLYVDLLSEITNTETSITWFPQDGDILHALVACQKIGCRQAVQSPPDDDGVIALLESRWLSPQRFVSVYHGHILSYGVNGQFT